MDRAVIILSISHVMMYSLNFLYAAIGYLPKTIFLMVILAPVAVSNFKKFNKVRTKAHGFKHILKNTIMFNLLEAFILFLTTVQF